MSKIFLYGRVSTSQQTLEQQERTAYEWLKAHGMSVDEVVTDEGVSGGVSYADRNLGKVLLPKMQEGDMIIVSEVSRLGRSMYDLSKLIHTELKPRKLRLVVACMGIDLNCAKITPVDQLILSNFAFAAELEKHLIRERTLSALAVKKQQGVKLGGAAGAWIENYNKKSNIEKHEIGMRRGATKNERHLLSRDVQAFIKALRSVFPDACKGDVTEWDFSAINTKETARIKLLSLMRDYKSFDSTLFAKWDLSGDDLSARPLQVKLAAQIQSLRNSVKKLEKQNRIAV